jgi:hypothetical protein
MTFSTIYSYFLSRLVFEKGIESTYSQSLLLWTHCHILVTPTWLLSKLLGTSDLLLCFLYLFIGSDCLTGLYLLSLLNSVLSSFVDMVQLMCSTTNLSVASL